jgi:hypothetical protein
VRESETARVLGGLWRLMGQLAQRQGCKRSIGLSNMRACRRFSRQCNDEFSEYARLRLDIDRAAVLFHDYVVAHRQAKPVRQRVWS